MKKQNLKVWFVVDREDNNNLAAYLKKPSDEREFELMDRAQTDYIETYEAEEPADTELGQYLQQHGYCEWV